MEEITKIIAKDIGSSGAIARSMAERIMNLHKDLTSAIDAYISGEAVSFALGDITLQTIMQKEHCTLVEALFSMSALLDNPELIPKYQSLNFRTGCLKE